MGMSGPNQTRSGRRSRRAPMAEINVTPMVDVMLVLLIIFMVAAPMMMAGVPVDLPDSRANALNQPEREPISISLDGQGQIFLGEEAVDSAVLPERLAEIATLAPGETEPPQIMLRADRALDYGQVMAVMGELNRAGLNRVSLVTTGSVEGQ